ncbi:MAG: hypothetical protein ABFD96_07750, partial [Armatimonadia bacterium]
MIIRPAVITDPYVALRPATASPASRRVERGHPCPPLAGRALGDQPVCLTGGVGDERFPWGWKPHSSALPSRQEAARTAKVTHHPGGPNHAQA